MHITNREVVADKETREKYPELKEGAHILTTTIEGDGPLPIASVLAHFDSEILSVVRTVSGGVEVKLALTIEEPEPLPEAEQAPVAPALTDEEKASAYLVSKGSSKEDADAKVVKFGAPRILVAQQKELDDELKTALAPAAPPDPPAPPAPPAPPTPTVN